MYRVFNNGIGYVLFAPKAQTEETLDRLAAMGEQAWVIGRVVRPKEAKTLVEFV